GELAEAIRDYSEAIQLNPQFVEANFNLAWLLASSPDQSQRDGQLALSLARMAGVLEDWQEIIDEETLAAPSAESGQFEEAVRWEYVFAAHCHLLNLVTARVDDRLGRILRKEALRDYAIPLEIRERLFVPEIIEPAKTID